MSATPLHTLPIDEEGYFILQNGIRLSDPQEGHQLLAHLQLDDNAAVWTTWGQQKVLVEPFDKPLVAQQVFKKAQKIFILAPYGFEAEISLPSLCLDAWDRFHGLSVSQIPFVMTRKAQAEFFNLLDEFDDDSITVDGHIYKTPPFYIDNSVIEQSQFWQEKYAIAEKPAWDLGQHHPALDAIMPQLKINKSRVLNLGCGRGHDAAYFAQLGHVVTGVDFSSQAISDAKTRYSHLQNVSWVQADALKNSQKFSADLIFEHTLFCAISPSSRKQLITQWKHSLDERGHLLGIFFVHPKRGGPPYGGSEWELREMLEKDFRLLYWKRWPLSPERRQGTELVIYAQKR